MSIKHWLIAVGVIAGALASCTRDNPKFCNANDDCDTGETCALPAHACQGATGPDATSPDAASPCEVDQECTAAATPICDDDDGVCRACDDHPECANKDAARPLCDGDGQCVECTASADCNDVVEPICDDDARACRGCDTSDECAARDAATPLCGASGGCVECLDHADCSSMVCDRGAGACVATADVIYVDRNTGSDTSDCGTAASPCFSILGGILEIAGTRTWVHIAPSGSSYQQDITINGTMTVNLVGPGAELEPNTTNRPALSIQGGAKVLIDGLRLRDALSSGSASSCDGVYCSDTGTEVTLRDARIDRNDGTGLDVRAGCRATVLDSVIENNALIGVNVDEGQLELRRSTVSNNDDGGVRVGGSSFVVVNNFITGNGTPGVSGSQTGGVSLIKSSAVSPWGLTGDVFAFNTVAGNSAGDSAQATSVYCFSPAAFSVSNNIVAGGVGTAAKIGGNCAWTYSNLEQNVAGDGNQFGMDPMFANPGSGNYHLTAESPCVDHGSDTPLILDDVDGDRRPLGAAHDIGADELAL